MNSFKTVFSYLRPITLRTRMLLLVTVLIVFMLGFIGMVFSNSIAQILEEQIGERALQVAQSVSRIPEIRHGLVAGDPQGRIQVIAEEIRKLTGAEFVVVGDVDGRRYSHPNPDRLGKLMVGGDNAPALEEGRSYTSRAVGTLGPSLRGKTPVLDDEGNIVGIISVGYLIADIKDIVRVHQSSVTSYIVLFIILGIIGAGFIAGDIKKAIFGLEPEEIARLYTERTAVLESIREGIIAIDTDCIITMANKASLRNLGYENPDGVVGKRIEELFPRTGMRDVLATGEPILDREVTVNGQEMILNILPIIRGRSAVGAVATFRPKDEIDMLVRELSHVRGYAEMLRAQTHEYSNKLHTLAGLMQIEAYKEALDLVAREASGYQNIIRFLVSAVPDPLLSAIVLGKYNRAQELRIRFSVDEESSLSDIPEEISRDQIITIIGNLLDNALEAVLDSGKQDGEVRMSMTDLGDDIIIEVEDSGAGIAEGYEMEIFQRGNTSKNKPHGGLGLFLVNQALEDLGGHVTIGSSELGGAMFTVIIPKETGS
ncbi:MAG: sensor histidine kinase [bacterium]|nr:sensor histidine kinase [bacterium]MDT8367238.1 sensor histidine kinase [bacterium]